MATQGIVLLLISYVSPIFPIKSHSIPISGLSCFLKPRNCAPTLVHTGNIRGRGPQAVSSPSERPGQPGPDPISGAFLEEMDETCWTRRFRSLKFSHRDISQSMMWLVCVADKKQTFGDVQSPKKNRDPAKQGNGPWLSLNKNTTFFSGSMLIGGMLDQPNWTNGD